MRKQPVVAAVRIDLDPGAIRITANLQRLGQLRGQVRRGHRHRVATHPLLEERIKPALGPVGMGGFSGELNLPPPDAFASMFTRQRSQHLPNQAVLMQLGPSTRIENILKHHEDECPLVVADETIRTTTVWVGASKLT